MANETYVTKTVESGLPYSSNLTVTPGSGLLLQNGGPLQPFNMTTTGFLNAVANSGGTGGYLISDGSGGTVVRSFANSATITANLASGVGGQTSFNMVNSSSLQNVTVQVNGGTINVPRSLLNFITGPNVGISAVDAGTKTNITITYSGAEPAPVDAEYWVSTANGTLTNEVNIGALTTGLLAVSVSAGTATPSTIAPTAGNLAVGNGTTWTALAIGASGTVLSSNGSAISWQPETGGAPASATYWTASANSILTNEVNLGALTTGVLGITVSGSVATPSIVTQIYEVPVSGILFVGTGAGNGLLTTGVNNTGVGRSSLDQVTSGANNTALGNQSGAANTTGYNNVYAGHQAGFLGTTANRNVVVGATAASNGAFTGAVNVFVGNAAGFSATTATDNIFIGNNAGQDTTTGTQNVAVGSGALQDNVAVSGITAVGYLAGGQGTTGINVSLFGWSAGTAGPGNNSTAVGSSALLAANTGATGNTAVGTSAGAGITTGDDNTVIGTGAGASLVTPGRVVAVGVGAGTGGGIVALTECTFVGRNATATVNALTNAGAIGANAIVAASDTLVLGKGAMVVIGDDGVAGIGGGYALNLMAADGTASCYMGRSLTQDLPASVGGVYAVSADDKPYYTAAASNAFMNGIIATANPIDDGTGSIGTATLVAGSVIVPTTAVKALSKIFLSRGIGGGTLGHLSIGGTAPGASFTINSSSNTDVSEINWWILNPE